ncbi:MAG: phosphodiester glycosidase family protein, partial [Limisphaerales bacterium]
AQQLSVTPWETQPLAPGVILRQHHFTNLFGAPQFIGIIEVDLRQTNAQVRFAAAYQYGWTNVVLPTLAEKANALVAVNAGFFGKEPNANSGILKIDGRVLPFTKQEKEEDLHFVGGSAVGIDEQGKWHLIVRPGPSWGDDWPEMRHAIAGGHPLIIQGQIHPSIKRDTFDFPRETRHAAARHPRTAIGVTTNQTALIVTADGRFPTQAVGLT